MPQDKHWANDEEAASLTLCLPQHYYCFYQKVTWSLITRSGPKALLSPSVGFEPADPKTTLGNWQGGRLTHLMLITALLHVQPEGTRSLIMWLDPKALLGIGYRWDSNREPLKSTVLTSPYEK